MARAKKTATTAATKTATKTATKITEPIKSDRPDTMGLFSFGTPEHRISRIGDVGISWDKITEVVIEKARGGNGQIATFRVFYSEVYQRGYRTDQPGAKEFLLAWFDGLLTDEEIEGLQ